MVDSESSPASASRLPALPSLDTTKSSTRILTRKINRPVRMPKTIDAWHRLQRIQHIDVTPTEGASTDTTVYSVHVYLHHHQNRIPSNIPESVALLSAPLQTDTCSLSDVHPDLTVSRTFEDLEKLRNNVWKAIRQYHPVYCELCDGLTMQMYTKLSQPALFTATIHRSRAKRAKKIRVFVSHVLSELHTKKSQCVAICKGQSELPVLLHEFLFGDELVSEP